MTKVAETAVPTTQIDAGDADIGAMRNIVGFRIRLAHGAVYRHFAEAFAQLELTQKQVALLWLIDDHPGIAQVDLAQRMRMDRATTMAIVNRLQGRDYLRRGKSSTDRRKQTLQLTEAGRGALSAAKEALAKHEAWLTARFTAAEVKTLIEMLSRIHE